MKRNTMLVAALLLATAVLSATAREARAAGDDPWPTRYRCAAGSFDRAAVTSRPDDYDEDAIRVSVPGRLTCDSDVPGAKFALAVYWVGSAYLVVHHPHALREYGSPKGPYTFRADGGILVSQPATICVLSDFDLRLACVEVRMNMMGAHGTVTTRTVSPWERYLDLPLRFTDNGLDPGCSNCWSVKP